MNQFMDLCAELVVILIMISFAVITVSMAVYAVKLAFFKKG